MIYNFHLDLFRLEEAHYDDMWKNFLHVLLDV